MSMVWPTFGSRTTKEQNIAHTFESKIGTYITYIIIIKATAINIRTNREIS